MSNDLTKLAIVGGGLYLLAQAKPRPPRPPQVPGGITGGDKREVDYVMIANGQKNYAISKWGTPGSKFAPLTTAYAEEILTYWRSEIRPLLGWYEHEGELFQLGMTIQVMPDPLPDRDVGGKFHIGLSKRFVIDSTIIDDRTWRAGVAAWNRFAENPSVRRIAVLVAVYQAGSDLALESLPDAANDVIEWWNALQRLAIDLSVSKSFEPTPSWSARVWGASVEALRASGEAVGEIAGEATEAAGEGIGALLGGLMKNPGGLLLIGAGVYWISRSK